MHDSLPSPVSSSEYRPEIDGLRAVAVMAVLLYHAGFKTLSGGFVGVDVFLVISGYLITRLLQSEARRTGRIDFQAFYLRRLRRILPALIATLTLSTVVAVWMFTPQRLEAFGGSLLHAALSVSNVFFYSETGYFDADSTLKPLLHTWSLGVEEQFYLVWPAVVLLVARRRSTAAPGYVLLGLASFGLATSFIATRPSAVFFLMPFRVFEFAIGALLVCVEERRPKHPLLANGLLLAGLGLILFSAISYSKQTRFPGLAALVPCAGAALCIHSSRDAALGVFLRSRAMVGVGLISYSLYLVHWPLIVFYKIHSGAQVFSLVQSCMIVVVSVLLACLMHLGVEKPLRRPGSTNGAFLFGITLATLALSYVGASQWATGGWAFRPWTGRSLSLAQINAGQQARFRVRQVDCERDGWDKCDDPVEGAVNVLVMGDSHASDAYNAFARVFPSNNYALSELGGCPPHPKIELITLPTHPDLEKCKALNVRRYTEAYLKRFDSIVINILFGWYTPDMLREYLTFLRKIGIAKVIVFGPYLSTTDDLPELLNKHGFDRVALEPFVVYPAGGDAALRAATEQLGYFFISKQDVFCRDGVCELFDSNHIPFTWDRHHLSFEFASRMAEGSREALAAYLEAPPGALRPTGAPVVPPIVQPTAPPRASSLGVGEWGPRTTPAGVVANIQPGGNMGLWIRVPGSTASAPLEIWFDGRPALSTNVQKDLVTAAIAPDRIRSPGSKEVAIRNTRTGEVLPVGTFLVTAR